jgi:hypothetical protein
MNLRRAALLKLGTQAQELEASVQRGRLARGPDGEWRLGDQTLAAWLQRFEGHELVLIAGLLDDERPPVVRTCGRCGRDYTDPECPHCQEVRHRLRPKW